MVLEKSKEYLKEFSELMKKWEATEIASNIDIVLQALDNSIPKEKYGILQQQLNKVFDNGFIPKKKLEEFIEQNAHTDTYNFKTIEVSKLKELWEDK